MTTNTTEKRLTLTIHEAADQLNLGVGSIYRMLRSGEIPAMRYGTKWVIPRAAFEAWLASCGRQKGGPA